MKHILPKDFFVFLMFLVMSAVFWVLTTLNETYEAEVEVRLEIADVPAIPLLRRVCRTQYA